MLLNWISLAGNGFESRNKVMQELKQAPSTILLSFYNSPLLEIRAICDRVLLTTVALSSVQAYPGAHKGLEYVGNDLLFCTQL